MSSVVDEADGFVVSDDAGWRPGRAGIWWSGLPDGPRNFLRRRFNRDNQTRVHLANRIVKRPGQIIVGAYTYGRPKVRFAETGARLVFGRYGSVADGVEILLGGNHRLDWVTTYPFPALPGLWPEAVGVEGSHATRGDVRIGHDVWLGSQALVLSGVTIGHGAVVAARAVVTRDVPPYGIVAGNPARLIRLRFDEATIASLLDSRWWELPEAEVKRLIPLLMSARIPELQAAAAAAWRTG